MFTGSVIRLRKKKLHLNSKTDIDGEYCTNFTSWAHHARFSCDVIILLANWPVIRGDAFKRKEENWSPWVNQRIKMRHFYARRRMRDRDSGDFNAACPLSGRPQHTAWATLSTAAVTSRRRTINYMRAYIITISHVIKLFQSRRCLIANRTGDF